MACTAIAAGVVAELGYALVGHNENIVAYGSFDPAGPARVEGTITSSRDGKWTRRDVYFYSVDGSRCHGWFYRPSSVADKLPVVVMASGLGAQIDFGM